MSSKQDKMKAVTDLQFWINRMQESAATSCRINPTELNTDQLIYAVNAQICISTLVLKLLEDEDEHIEISHQHPRKVT